MQLMSQHKLEHLNHHLSAAAAAAEAEAEVSPDLEGQHQLTRHQQQQHHHQLYQQLSQELEQSPSTPGSQQAIYQELAVPPGSRQLPPPPPQPSLAVSSQQGGQVLSQLSLPEAPQHHITAPNNSNMNIQPTEFTKSHLIGSNNGHLTAAEELSIKKRREDLSRRPSYRKIFNDLTALSGPLDPPSGLSSLAGLAPPLAAPSSRPQPQPQQQQHQPQQTQVVGAPPNNLASNARLQAAQNNSPSPTLDLLSGSAATTTTPTGPPPLQDPDSSRSPVSSVIDLQTTHLGQLPPFTSNQHQQHQHHHHHLQQAPPHPLHLHQQQPHLQQQQQQQQHLQQHLSLQASQQPPSALSIPPSQQQHQQQQHHPHHHLQAGPPPQQQHQQQASQIHPHHIHSSAGPASTPSPLGQPAGVTTQSGGPVVYEEVTKKRELRLQKNREAAKECRRKKKEYIKCLENRVAVLENQNKALIDELKTLKNLYCKSTTE